jgi:hypothetical protein
MKKELIISVFFAVCLFSNSVFAETDTPKITDLTPWKGFSVSNLQLYESEAGDTLFTEVAKYASEGYTPETVKEFFFDMFSMKFECLKVIDENTLTIDNRISGDYVHVGTLLTKWNNYDISWEIFKTNSKEMIGAGYKYILLMPFHQDTKDGLRHCHLRYGNEGFDYLATDPSIQSWWPTIYQPEGTDEIKVMAEMIKGAKQMSTMLPPLK